MEMGCFFSGKPRGLKRMDSMNRGFESYFDRNMLRVEKSFATAAPGAPLRLMASFLTIADIRDLLYDPRVNLATDITTQLIQEVLRVDLGRAIGVLRESRDLGPHIRQASGSVDNALLSLYKAIDANSGAHVGALIQCRNHLEDAYQQLGSVDEIVRTASAMGIEVHPGSSSLRRRSAERTDFAKPRPPTRGEPPAYGPPDQRKDDPADEVFFTAFHPKEGAIQTWYSLLVYTHIASALEKVRRDKKRFDKVSKTKTSKASRRLARGTELRIEPACEGIMFNPQQITFRWLEDFHRTEFRFKADESLLGDDCFGQITIFVGPLIVGELKFVMSFNDAETRGAVEHEEQAEMYHKDAIFVSYSSKDTLIVEAFKAVHKATGHDVLRDIDQLRSGQDWKPEIMRLIDRADIFQLFWSPNSSQSKYCREEWEYALKKNKAGFIRPLFWEQPFPKLPDELRDIHFAYVDLKLSPTEDKS
jgi:hypothetical protein